MKLPSDGVSRARCYPLRRIDRNRTADSMCDSTSAQKNCYGGRAIWGGVPPNSNPLPNSYRRDSIPLKKFSGELAHANSHLSVCLRAGIDNVYRFGANHPCPQVPAQTRPEIRRTAGRADAAHGLEQLELLR